MNDVSIGRRLGILELLTGDECRLPRPRFGRLRRAFWHLFGYHCETCHRCGRPVELVWSSPDELWHEVFGTDAGVRCARCFDAECAALGISLMWAPTVSFRGPA